MKTYVLMHIGFQTPTQQTMDAWSAWFASLQDRLAQNTGPFLTGVEITATGTRDLPLDRQAVTG